MSDYWHQVRQKVDGVHSERERLAQEASQTEQLGTKAWADQESLRLVELNPALRNPEKAEAFRNRIFAYGKRNGYTDEELRGIVDHRDIMTAYKAARYDEIMASRKGNTKPGKQAPKDVNSSRPRNIGKGKNRGTGRNARDADRRLAKTGRIEDAAMSFTEMLGNPRH